jgi:hypothetical protein
VVGEFSDDPKGYYTMLGLSGDADAAEIKLAFRTKAKRLHPDINPSPIAAKQFQRLTEAYDVLSDTLKRSAYDRTRPAARPKKQAKPETAQKKAEKKSSWTADKPKPRESVKPAAGADTAASGDTGLKPEMCQCGKVTAQPRYVEFDMVAGQGRTVKHKTVSGVFCRSCADRAALKASFVTWLTGWWAIPHGPKETVKALWNNIRGGRKPADRNTHLLIRQAKAFRDRGDLTLARGTAEQALAYARTPALRREVDILLLSLSAHSPKHLKTRWDKPGWAPVVQLAPVIALVVWASMSITMSTPVSLTAWVTNVISRATGKLTANPITAGSRISVSTDALNLRTGPSQNYQVLLILPKNAEARVIELSPDGDWVRIEAPDGTQGFVPLRAVKAVITPPPPAP